MIKTKSLLLLFLYVYSLSFIYACFVAYGLNDISFFVQANVWALIPSFAITTLFILLNPHSFIFELSFYVCAILFSIFAISQAVIFQSPFDVESLYIMLYSGKGEIKVFLETFLSVKLLLILSVTSIIPLYVWKCARRNRYLWTLKQKGILLILSLCLLLIPVHANSLSEALNKHKITLSSIEKNMRRLFYVKLATYIPKVMMIVKLDTSPPSDVRSLFDDTQTIVLIVTESINRNNLSIYGYPRKTTPKLKESKILVYQDVLSAFPVTHRSVPHMLTFSNLQSSNQKTTIYDFFRAAGFTSYYFDGYEGVNYNEMIHLIGFRADNIVRRKKYDGELFDAALAVIKNDPTKKKLILIHTETAHFPYTMYPHTMETFSGTPPKLYTGADPTKRNHYDTAILYLDNLIGYLLQNIADEKNTVVLVTSDHGQEVGNYSTTYGHSSATRFLSCYEVPFFLYISDDYKKTLKDAVFNTKRPYQTDNLIHSIIDLAHIESPLFKPEYSIFNKAYQEPIQMIGGKRYTERKIEENTRKKEMEKE